MASISFGVNTSQKKSLASILGKKNSENNAQESFNSIDRNRNQNFRNIHTNFETKELTSNQNNPDVIIVKPHIHNDNIWFNIKDSTGNWFVNTVETNMPQVQARTKYDKNSLAYIFLQQKKYVIKLCECKIDDIFQQNVLLFEKNNTNNGISPQDMLLLEKFRQKYSEIKNDWNMLINFMIEKIAENDSKYIEFKYYGLKEMLMHHIYNIIVSYILIGPEARHGSGIDNIHGEYTLRVNENKSSIKENIKSFFKILPIALEKISIEYLKLSKLNNEHKQLSDQFEIKMSFIGTLRTSINFQEKDIVKKKMDIMQKESIKQNLDENKSSLEAALASIEKINEKITKINEGKTLIKKEIYNQQKSFTDYINFNYFMHNEWFPILDGGFVE